MKILSVVTARSIWLINLNELNPKGLKLFPSTITALKDRHQFLVYPTKIEDADPGKGIQFQGGSFRTNDGEINTDLTIFHDGFVCTNQSSTMHADAFLGDILTWSSKKLGLAYEPKMIRKRSYLSELIVQTSRHFSEVSDKIKQFSQKLSSQVSSTYGEGIDMELAGLTFANDLSNGVRYFFRFERKENASFSEERYYSSAPVSTEDHIELLNEFENIFTS